MALSRVKTWISGEVLTASDLNAEFNNLLNNARDLVSPLTGVLDMNGFELIMDADADSSLTADTNNRLDVRLGGVDLFVFDGTTASSVNGLTFTGVIAGSAPTIAATGSDTNIPVTLKGKGTGRVILGQATSTDVQLAADQALVDSSGNEFFKFSKTATAVNEVTVGNAATGSGPALTATGGDTNAPITVAGKGTGAVILGQATSTDVRHAADQPIGDSSGNELIKFTKAATAINEITVANAAASAHPEISSTGGDTNINLKLTPKGSGTIDLNGGVSGTAVATQAEMETATATNRVVSPGRQQNHPGSLKAWVRFQGASGTIDASYNVTSVTRNGTGDYTVNFTTAFSSANYFAAHPITTDTGASNSGGSACKISSQAAGSFRFTVARADAVGFVDPTTVEIGFAGDQ